MSRSQATFSGDPALPTTLPAPRSRANWPTRLPTAPAAPETNTSSPSRKAPTRNSPAYAASPGMPSTPRNQDGGTSVAAGSRVAWAASRTAVSRHAAPVRTNEPSGSPGAREATTRPTAPPRITSPTFHGGAYEGSERIRPRMYGSTDMTTFRTTTCPSAGSGTGTSTSRKSAGVGSPCGRAARCHSRVVADMPRSCTRSTDVPAGTPSGPRPRRRSRGHVSSVRTDPVGGLARTVSAEVGRPVAARGTRSPCGTGLRSEHVLLPVQDPAGGSCGRAAGPLHPADLRPGAARGQRQPHPAAVPGGHADRRLRGRVLLGRGEGLLGAAGRLLDRGRVRRRPHAQPDLRGGLLGADRPHRGRAGRLRPGGDLLRAAAQGLLGGPRPDPGHAPGQRRRHPVPLGDLLRVAGAGGGRPGQPRGLPAAADRGRLRRDHHGDRAGRRLLLRRGLPPAVPVQGPQRLLPDPLDRRLLPGGPVGRLKKDRPPPTPRERTPSSPPSAGPGRGPGRGRRDPGGRPFQYLAGKGSA